MTARTFDLTEQHVKLLRAMYVGWQDMETGAPEIDPKRPYGNGDVPADVHKILTEEFVDNDDVVLTDKQREAYSALHRETETALQIVLATGQMEPGVYQVQDYSKNWQRIGDLTPPLAPDPVAVREEAIRLIGMDYVPLDVLVELVSQFTEKEE